MLYLIFSRWIISNILPILLLSQKGICGVMQPSWSYRDRFNSLCECCKRQLSLYHKGATSGSLSLFYRHLECLQPSFICELINMLHKTSLRLLYNTTDIPQYLVISAHGYPPPSYFYMSQCYWQCHLSINQSKFYWYFINTDNINSELIALWRFLPFTLQVCSRLCIQKAHPCQR